MWKFVARGIRETLERRTCRTNVYSQSSQESNTKNEVKASLTCNHKFLAPSFTAFNNEFCGSSKSSGTKDKDHDSNYTKYTWSEAIGWSSVLAVGWVVCQTLCLRRRLFENEKTDSLKNKLSQFPEQRIFSLFGQVLNFKPTNILPAINCVGNNKIYAQENTESDWKAEKPFGPITIEEALKEATEEFANTHKLTMAEFELHYGLKALEERRYKDAVKHFTGGANLSSAASMFNLGLCYELGLGTLVDYTKAAKYYNDAAEQDHADATYNLGVFHAQGKGGFMVDIDRARSYFIKAAKLGQIQAQHALDLEKRYYQSKETEFPDKCENTVKYLPNKNMNNILKKLINYNNVLNTQSDVEFLENSGREQGVVGSRNPTELFLDMLGLKESNILTVPLE
ncbi:protein SHC1-like [Osmia bicornis bicornis]|uniref:protein SHC1-like n=1 Tax=Osmia bicornis bicornis TaxID=1437191 RepID=UPI0010F81D8E|nr:protein SHC1-like [Osmia bicornis bicornis]